ncbi:M24 family metallopeptidase [Salinibaculum sp. GCM10025337]|uniref:M24 family metallopeptidase n=2 Tax=Salinibaculum TaxID=2732368 RepID=UPI003606DE1D
MPLINRDFERPFSDSVYQDRLARAQQQMDEEGLDALLLSEPTNQQYLSGYESQSWFTFQMLLVLRDEPQPVFTARNMEERAAEITTWMDNEYVRCYSDDYAPNSLYHPTQWVVELLEEYGYADGRVGIEEESNYLSMGAYDRLKRNLPEASLENASGVVNWLYFKKSEEELEYMREAARITDAAMETTEEVLSAGVRECDAAAAIMQTLMHGTEEYGGDMPKRAPEFGPFHFEFSTRELQDGDVFGVEFAGCRRSYSSPLCRTVHVGEPSSKRYALWEELDEDLQLVLDTVEPGKTCEEVEQTYRENANHPKASRSGYATGLGLTGWGEGTASFTEGDETVLEPGMTFHSNPSIDTLNRSGGVGPERLRMLHSETYVVTEDGCEVFGNYPRKLIVV